VGGTEVPLLAFEVLSPGTARMTRAVKRRRYLEAGVAEVWLVDPSDRSIEVHAPGGVRRATGATPARSAALPAFDVSPGALLDGLGGPGPVVR
jgi:Uma2 family endonuclease